MKGAARRLFDFQPARYPDLPGCYLMKDASGRILYVGKSVKLRSRLGSYFREQQPRENIGKLVGEIADIEIILVRNEPESLILENNLIKMHKPPYNRALKADNSGYAYLCLTDERLPRLTEFYRNRKLSLAEDAVRQRIDSRTTRPEARFGPFVSAHFRASVMAFVNEHYRLRTCESLPKRACLQYHIHKCSGVCEGMISEADYLRDVREASALLADGGERLIPGMYRQMELYAERLEFEKAGSMLRHIRILERQEERQIVDRETAIDQDVVYFGNDRVLVANVREGMLYKLALFELDGPERAESPGRFMADHYAGVRPGEIILNAKELHGTVVAALRKKGRPTPRVTVPKRGLKRELLELCRINFEFRVRTERRSREDGTG